MNHPWRRIGPTRIALITLLSLFLLAPAYAAPADIRPQNVDVTYPRVEGYGPADAVINQRLRQEIDGFAEVFRQPDTSGKVGYEVGLADARIFSITINEMHYVYRAAHPTSYLRAFTGVRDEQEFYLTADSVVVFYQRAEFTPYSYGFLEFPIPYADIAAILKPEFLPQNR